MLKVQLTLILLERQNNLKKRENALQQRIETMVINAPEPKKKKDCENDG